VTLLEIFKGLFGYCGIEGFEVDDMAIEGALVLINKCGDKFKEETDAIKEPYKYGLVMSKFSMILNQKLFIGVISKRVRLLILNMFEASKFNWPIKKQYYRIKEASL